MMKKLALLATTAAVALGGMSAHAASDIGDVNATVLTPIAITIGNALSFGEFTVDATGGTVDVSSGSGTAVTGDVVSVTPGAAAAVAVLGEASTAYNLTVPASTTINDGGANNMTVALREEGSGNNGSLLRNLDPLGEDAFFIAGLLTVGASQPAGNYSGTYTLSADY